MIYGKKSLIIISKKAGFYFNLTIYGGGYSTWIKKLADVKDSGEYGYENKVIPENTPIHPFMGGFKKQCGYYGYCL